MPIKIPADLPARASLEEENIFVMTEERALSQDIRPLEIAIVNLMPTKIATETQLLRLLGNTPLQVNVTLVHTKAHVSRNTPAQHLEKFYKTFAEIRGENFDGVIVTGAPVEHLAFNEVDYWDELGLIMNFAASHAASTLYICWAAQAALYHFHGIDKHLLPDKISGVFRHGVLTPTCRLFRGFDDEFYAPHSRHTGISREDICACPELTLLSESPEAGVCMVEARGGRDIFITGHLEYDAETLAREYRRDLDRGLNPRLPENYFPDNDPDRAPPMRWRAHAHLFFSNWLNYYVYQETPYNLALVNRT